MSNFPQLQASLRKLHASGSTGFEGLIRNCLESLSNRNFKIVKSGPQKGKDVLADNAENRPLIAIEAKRYGANTHLSLDALKSKLREAIESSPSLDIWGLASTQETKQPDWSELEAIGQESCVTLICLDWRDFSGTLPALAVICCAGRHYCEKWDKSLSSVFDNIELHPDYDGVKKQLYEQLTFPASGFDLVESSAKSWLTDAVSSIPAARQRLNNHSDILSREAHLVSRPGIEGELDNWWKSGGIEPAVLIGDEGCGKTWVALKWIIDLMNESSGLLPIVVSAKNILKGSAEEMLAGAIEPFVPSVDSPQLKKRIMRWVQSSSTIRIVLIVDGLNERWDFDWVQLTDSFEDELWKGKISLLLTSRKTYWEQTLLGMKSALAAPIRNISVPKFSDQELKDFLDSFGISSNELSSGLLKLAHVPRFARLAITLRDQLGEDEEVTQAMLVLEDWRSRLKERKLSIAHEDLLIFVANLGNEILGDPGFTISLKEIHESLAADSGFSVSRLRADISEITEGNWLTTTSASHRYKVNELLLPYAIGLDLARAVENLSSKTAAKEEIASYLEQLRGADIAVSILRAATTTSFLRGRSSNSALEALLETWINSQNFMSIDFDEMWPLINRDVDIFLKIGEETWTKEPVQSGKSEVLIKGLANASKWHVVQNKLVNRFPKWVGSYGLDPVNWAAGYPSPQNDSCVQRSKSNIDAWHIVEEGYALKVSKNLRADEKNWLADAAFSVISNLERAPYLESIITWCVAQAVMEFSAGKDFKWLIRLNSHDYDLTKEKILEEIKKLQCQSNSVADRVSNILLSTLSSPKAKSPTSSELENLNREPLILTSKNTIKISPSENTLLDENFRILQAMGKYATDPNVKVNAEVKQKMAEVEIDFSVDNDSHLNSLENRRSEIMTLSRWMPAQHARLLKKAMDSALFDQIGGFNRGINHSAEIILILTETERQVLYKKAVEELRKLDDSSDRTKRSDRAVLQEIILAASISESSHNRLDILRLFSPEFRFGREYARIMPGLSRSELKPILNEIVRNENEHATEGWLGYIGAVRWEEDDMDQDILLKLTMSDNDNIRSQAMSLLLSFSSKPLLQAFVEAGWAHKSGDKLNEAITGSYIICKNGEGKSLDALSKRIVPQAYPYLIQERGCLGPEVDKAFDWIIGLLEEEIQESVKSRSSYPHIFPTENIWQKMVEKDSNSITTRCKVLAETGRLSRLFNVIPVIEMLGAILKVSPADGVEIWSAAAVHFRRSNLQVGGFDSLIFNKVDHLALNGLRRDVFESVKDDAELAQRVMWCLKAEQEEWLLATIHNYVKSPNIKNVALGLTLAAFLDSTKAADEFWESEIHKIAFEGWLKKVKARSVATYKANTFARHWLKMYFEEKDSAIAYDYFNLFVECLDSRALVWSIEIAAHYAKNTHKYRVEYYDLRASSRRTRREKVKNERKKTLFFSNTSKYLSPWY